MQINPADSVVSASASASAAVSVRVLAGNLTAVPLGALLQAVVTQVTPREATLNVNGESLTIRPPAGLEAGAVLFVRVPKSANGTLELADPPRAPKAPQLAAPAGPSQVQVVDVTDVLPDGRVRARIDGQEYTATVGEPLAPGGRYLLEVARTPTGIVLREPPDGPVLPVAVATAILRAAPPPDLAATIKPLQAELAALVGAQPAGAVRDAATTVCAALQALVPSEPRPLDAPELQRLVENGGLHFEAKLARLTLDAGPGFARANEATGAAPERIGAESGSPGADPVAPDAGRAPVATALKGDLKGDLLRLLHAAQELGVATQVPAARAALDGIESQQATQVLAQASATPYLLQVPFPDGGAWRTLHLSVEREVPPNQVDPERAGRFRMLMHVPLSELGDTWIDAGLSGGSFRAAIYLDRADVRARVAAALPDLRAELRADGFDEVLLDVRPTDALPASAKRRSAAMSAGRPESASLLDVRV